MTELARIGTKADRTFILVCLNFVMLFVLFCGLGYVTWRSAALVHALGDDLDQAENTIRELKARIREMDVDAVTDRVAQAAVDRLKSSVETAVEEAGFVIRARELAEKIEAAQDRLNQAADTIRAINDRLQAMDAERIGQAVSYHTLKGIGEGFTRAAEARKPDAGN